MTWTAADWSIDKDTKVVDYIGHDHTRFGGTTPSYATVIEMHRAVQALADDATYSGDDEMDITIVGASERSTDNIITMLNGWTITAAAAEHLYDGSIIQANGDTIYDGIVNFGNTANIQLLQNGAIISDDWWNTASAGLNADTAAGISHRFMIRVRNSGSDIDGRRLIGTSRNFNKTFSEFKINGSTRGNNVLALSEVDDLNNATSAATVSGWTDVTNTAGYSSIDADGNATPENYYSDWEFGSRTVNQFYERLKWLTRKDTAETLYGLSGEVFRGITHQIPIDTPTGTFSAVEAVSWSGGTGQMLAINSTTAGTIMWIQLLTGVAPTDNQTITGGTSSATCLVNGTATERSISTPFVGVATGSAIIGAYGVGIGSDDLTAADKVTDLTNTVRTPPNNVTFTVTGLVSSEDRVLVGPLGYRFAYDAESGGPFTIGETLTFTSPAGTAVLHALQDDGTTGYMVISEAVTGSLPTDNSTISGGTSGATANVNGSVTADIAVRQFTLNTALTAANITSVVIATTIPTDTPTTGTIRVADDNGKLRRLVYTSYTGSTFTIDPSTSESQANADEADFNVVNASSGNKVWISYIDKLAGATQESFTVVYSADRNLFVRVRDGGASPIKPFETTGTLGTAGGSATAIRTSDA
jgi:hypothetical protein